MNHSLERTQNAQKIITNLKTIIRSFKIIIVLSYKPIFYLGIYPIVEEYC